MSIAALRRLLAMKAGLAPSAVSAPFLATAAQRSLAATGHSSLANLVKDAQQGGRAWDIVLEQVLVPETWFFRDRAPFAHLPAVAREAWLGSLAAPVRILCCPCSTGEEAYSIAIALVRAGLRPNTFAIEAADVNLRALGTARAAIYGPHAFRGVSDDERAQHFDRQPDAEAWRVKPAYRALVEFRRANVLSPGSLGQPSTYDVVLCRNVLIYLHDDARAQVMNSLRALLRPGGVLFVGHAEAALALAHGFIVHGAPDAFAFRDGRTQANSPTVVGSVDVGPPSRRPMAARRTPESTPPARSSEGLARIQHLGDAGRTLDALTECRAYLAEHPASPDGHFLLGVLQSALGHTAEATLSLQRTLYLAPAHAGASLHLAALHESLGDRSRAARLRTRVATTTQAGEP